MRTPLGLYKWWCVGLGGNLGEGCVCSQRLQAIQSSLPQSPSTPHALVTRPGRGCCKKPGWHPGRIPRKQPPRRPSFTLASWPLRRYEIESVNECISSAARKIQRTSPPCRRSYRSLPPRPWSGKGLDSRLVSVAKKKMVYAPKYDPQQAPSSSARSGSRAGGHGDSAVGKAKRLLCLIGGGHSHSPSTP